MDRARSVKKCGVWKTFFACERDRIPGKNEKEQNFSGQWSKQFYMEWLQRVIPQKSLQRLLYSSNKWLYYGKNLRRNSTTLYEETSVMTQDKLHWAQLVWRKASPQVVMIPESHKNTIRSAGIFKIACSARKLIAVYIHCTDRWCKTGLHIPEPRRTSNFLKRWNGFQ